MNSVSIIKGHVVFTDSASEFTVIENGYIISEQGCISDVCPTLPQKYAGLAITDYGDSLIIPGFYDLHNHAGQYLQCGTGMNKQLLEWLQDYTYKLEKDLADPTYASRVYRRYVEDLYRYGTLGACAFATSSTEGTECLFEEFKNIGLRGFVGKVNMDCNAPEFIIEDAQKSLAGTRYLVEKYKDEPLVRPIVTPRFAPTSTREALQLLGDLVVENGLPVQSHLSENLAEIEWVKELFPEYDNYASVYAGNQLFGDTPTLMAHAVYLTEEEVAMCKRENIYLVHCPDSNINVRSGIAPVKEFLELGLKVGLGSDIAGGHKIQMNEAIVRAVQSSKVLAVERPEAQLSLSEAFYMATVTGGEFFGQLGKLKRGYQLDALVIDDDPLYKERYSLEDRLEKFLYIGDDRWIGARYVGGELLELK